MKAIYCVVLVLLVGCAVDPAPAPLSYFPLEKGNWWKYVRQALPGGETTITVGDAVIVHDTSYTAMEVLRIVPRICFDQRDTLYVRMDAEQRVFARYDTTSRGVEEVLIDPILAQGYTESDDSPVADGRNLIVAVPVGTFSGCIRVASKQASAGGYAETFALGVGRIRMSSFYNADELTAAYVGGVSYPR